MAFREMTKEERGTSLGDILALALSGGIQGYTDEKKRLKEENKTKLDTTVKLLELQEKMQKIEIEKKTFEQNQNFMKAFGITPMDQAETDNARSTSFSGINGQSQAPKINTAAGKLGEIYGQINPEDYETIPEYNTKSGLTFKVKKKKVDEPKSLTPGQNIELQEKIRAHAEKMAYREVAEKLKQNWDVIKNGPLTDLAIKSSITQDVVDKYLKPSELFLTGKTTEYDKSMKNIRKKLQEDADPFGLLSK